MNNRQTLASDSVPVSDYIREPHTPISHLAHGWELYTAVTLTPAEDRTMVREPAQAVPAPVAQRLGSIRVLLVPYVECTASGDLVSFSKPKGESHTSVWTELDGLTHVVLACRELDPHDTGFEFLATLAELLRPHLTPEELSRYTALVREEIDQNIPGEIDEESLDAKEHLLKTRGTNRRAHQFESYRDTSFTSTMAEYTHGLWHDVQIRIGPEHLPLPQLRRRMKLLAELFPPNPGYSVFAEGLEEQ